LKNLASILSEFLQPSAPVVFGRAGESAVRPAAVDTDRLIRRLDRQVRFNNRLILTIVGAYVLLLLIASTLVVAHHKDTNWIIAFVGGNFLALMTIGTKLQDTWREKNYMDMMLAVLPTLTPPEAMKMLQSFYLEKIQSAGRKSPAQLSLPSLKQ
jgi:hypothetical protein